MVSRLSPHLFVLLLIFSLQGCSWFYGDRHEVVCNKLKSDIVFNAATVDTRRAEIQSSEKPLIQHTYDTHGCAE